MNARAAAWLFPQPSHSASPAQHHTLIQFLHPLLPSPPLLATQFCPQSPRGSPDSLHFTFSHSVTRYLTEATFNEEKDCGWRFRGIVIWVRKERAGSVRHLVTLCDSQGEGQTQVLCSVPLAFRSGPRIGDTLNGSPSKGTPSLRHRPRCVSPR